MGSWSYRRTIEEWQYNDSGTGSDPMGSNASGMADDKPTPEGEDEPFTISGKPFKPSEPSALNELDRIANDPDIQETLRRIRDNPAEHPYYGVQSSDWEIIGYHDAQLPPDADTIREAVRDAIERSENPGGWHWWAPLMLALFPGVVFWALPEARPLVKCALVALSAAGVSWALVTCPYIRTRWLRTVCALVFFGVTVPYVSARIYAGNSNTMVVPPSSHFVGGIVTAMDVLIPREDHRIVYVTAWIQNDGRSPSNLDLWTITANDASSGELLDARVLKPARPFVARFTDPKTSLQTTIKYNMQNALPSEGAKPLKPGDRINGGMMLWFAREINTATIKITFRDDANVPYTIGEDSPQMMP